MDYDDSVGLDADQPETEDHSAPQGEVEPKAIRELRQENRSLRERLRRSELEAEYGKDIAELVPSSLPLEGWKDYAARLVEFRQASAPAPTDSEPAAAPTEERTEREERLAAVAAPQATGTPQEILSAKEIADLMINDPAAGLKAANAKYAGDRTAR